MASVSASSSTITVTGQQPWTVVRSPASVGGNSQSSHDTWSAESISDVGSSAGSESDDLVYHFKQMGLPDYKTWARKFQRAGYKDMDDLTNAEAPLDDIFQELSVPSGVMSKLRTGLERFKNGSSMHSMPEGDLDATAPMQTQAGFNWALFFGVTVAGLVVGGIFVIVLRAAAAAAAGGAAAAEGAAAGGAAFGGVGWAAVAGGMAVLSDCLDGDTLVTMADRTTKRIRDVKAGDKILTYNKGKTKVKAVIELKEGTSSNMRRIVMKDEVGKEFFVKATGGHPFYTKENGWSVLSPESAEFDASRPVKKLVTGDTLVLKNGKLAQITKISELLPRQKTFNVVIDGPGVFFAQGILSHSGLPPSEKR